VVDDSASDNDKTGATQTTPIAVLDDSSSAHHEHGHVWLILVVLGYAFALFLIFMLIWLVWYGASLRERRRFALKQHELSSASPPSSDLEMDNNCGQNEQHNHHHYHANQHHGSVTDHHLHNGSRSELLNATMTTTSRPPMTSSISANSTMCRPLSDYPPPPHRTKRIITNCTYTENLVGSNSNTNLVGNSRHLFSQNQFSLDVTNSPYSPRAPKNYSSNKTNNNRSSVVAAAEEDELNSIYSNPRKVNIKSLISMHKSAAVAAAHQSKSNYCKYRL
jgi:hypothetical protein